MRVVPIITLGEVQTERGLVQQQGSAASWANVGVLSHMACHHIIPSHPVTSLAREGTSRPLPHLLVPTYTLPPYWAMLRRLLCPALPLRA